ncbi:MAG TPA: ATP-binding protein [Bacillota bacterium]|nr:ATP-binding protein [Bacillota bacterium]
MTLRIFRNAFLASLAAVIACTLFFVGIMYYSTHKLAFERLSAEAEQIASALSSYGDDYINTVTHASRVTLVAADGTVLFDNTADPSKMENHSSREEIREALGGGTGECVRMSSTLLKNTLYYSKRLPDGRVLRVATTQDSVLSMSATALIPLFLGILLALALSGVLASRLANDITKPIYELNPEKTDALEVYPELLPLLESLLSQQRTIRAQMDELSRRQREFAAITENMREGFILVDNRRTILSCNRSGLVAISEHPRAYEKTISRVWCKPQICDAVDCALAGERNEVLVDIGGRVVQVIASPVVSNLQVAGAVLLTMDVTEREQREALRREFTANVSHQLKTPLTSISGFAELLKEGFVPPEKVREFASDIYSESRRLIALIDDIIKLSRLDEGVPSTEREPVDLYELCDEIIEYMQPVAQKRSVSLNLQGEHVKILGVWSILNDIIYSLCDNAIKYNKPGGEVTINIKRSYGEVELSVSDTGVGIPYELQNRVFERFYRVEKSQSPSIGGTGLGLSIVKHGAQFHGARVELESEPGFGSKFTVIFPPESVIEDGVNENRTEK